MSGILTPAFLDFAGPVTFGAWLLWLYSLWPLARAGRSEGKGREWGISAALALGGAIAVFLSLAVDFKVLSDETNLLSVANMLALFGKASNTEMWTYYYHTYHALIISVPSRPILFPVLTALVHAVAGVSAASPFAVNFLCLAGLFFLALQWSVRLFSAWGRALMLAALLMNSALLIVATSAGFDLSSLFFAFLACRLWQKYLAAPAPALKHALFFTVVCFASVRYESILALPLLFAALWWTDRRIPWKLAAGSLALTWPIFAQRYLTWGSFENPSGVAPFSPAHFLDHARPFAEAFFLDPHGPYPVLLHWLGLGGLFYALLRPRPGTLVPLAYGGFLFVLLLSHHFGFAGHPTQVRLFLPLTLGLTALAFLFLKELEGKLDLRWATGIFLALFLHHHQYSLLDPLSSQLTMTREVRHLRDFVGEGASREDLFVYDRPGQLVALGLSAISWDHFGAHRGEFLANLRNGLYRRVLFVERVPYADPVARPLARDGFSLTSLFERQLSGEERLRVARVDLPPGQ